MTTTTPTHCLTNARNATGPTTGGEDPEWSLERYIHAVADEGRRFADVARAGNLDLPVADCPGWNLRDLVRHVGMVHLWAAANIVHPSDRWITVKELSDLADYWPEYTQGWPTDAGLVDWYEATLVNLVDVLLTTPPDHQCLTFLPAPSPLVMWARRQASEIAIHRFDAEAARGRLSHFDPEFALEMLDELLLCFAPRMRPVGVTGKHVLQMEVVDVDVVFTLTIEADGITATRSAFSSGAGSVDLRLSGSAADLYLLLWNRPNGHAIELDGDDAVLDLWRQVGKIQWR